jgi:hypothetical protein
MMRVSRFAWTILLSCSLTVAASAWGEGAMRLEAQRASPQADKKSKPLSDSQIRKILIEESIAAYSGNCPCPYSRARNGSRCGRRSAYDRPGGEAPLCFERDVTEEMVRGYRDAHAEE